MDSVKPAGTTSKVRMIVFQIPTDEKLLAALGTVSLRHSQMDYILRMTIKTLTGVTQNQAMHETKFRMSRTLRDRIKKLAKARLGDGPALIQLQELLERFKRASEERNELVHSVWFRYLNGDTLKQSDGHDAREIPTVATLDALSAELVKLRDELNAARLTGFLHEALAIKK